MTFSVISFIPFLHVVVVVVVVVVFITNVEGRCRGRPPSLQLS